ncbi:MAG: cell division ATP-binding protein FtsE [Cytophagales bacterium]|nr:cell division ATP-binding protein FtsE [Armatimonadota bacterium]
MQAVTIELSHVGVTYKSGQANSVSALGDVSLCIPQGDFVFLVGPTGAGKSTLLKLLYQDVRPTTGAITVGEFDLAHLRQREVPKLRRRMGIVLQDYGLLPQRTVWENIAFACQVLGQRRRDIRVRIPEVLDLVGMTHRCDAFPTELSGGEQQRVAIARALVNHPPLLLADEPTGNLDPETGAGVMQVLLEANRRGATVICATHDKTAVDRLRRRVVAVEKGQIARDEPEGMYGYEA